MSSSISCFDWASSFYDYTRGIPDDLLKKTIETLQQKTNIKSNSRLLEVGIGTGRIAIPITEKLKLNTIGIDISEKMLKKCLTKTTPSIRTHLIIADGLALPFSRENFDIILTCHFLHFLPNVYQFVNNMTPLLVENGYYINLDAHVEYDQTQPFQIYHDKLTKDGYHYIQKGKLIRRGLTIYLLKNGWKHEQSIINSKSKISINNLVRFIRDRVFSYQRAINEDIHQHALKHLYSELKRQDIDLSRKIMIPAISRLEIFQYLNT